MIETAHIGRGGKLINAEDFVKTWQESQSADEVAQKIGTSRLYVTQRSYLLRKKGVKLKRMTGGPARIDVAALNRIIDGAQGKAPK